MYKFDESNVYFITTTQNTPTSSTENVAREKKNANFSSRRKTISSRSKDFRERRRRQRRSWCRETNYVMSGARTTRAQKRQTGERDLWSLIVKCDDICFTHIIPRLNQTDVKFLFEVNTETRKLVKRSSRAGDLKKKFKVEEMSSISTLEVAWEHKSLWPRHWDETYFCEKGRSFCHRVARTNKLELLKWAREEKKCTWDSWTI